MIETELMAYLFNLLEKKERIKCEEHLKTCPVCFEKLKVLTRIKEAVENEPMARAPDQLALILKRAREREEAQEKRNALRAIMWVRVLDYVRKNTFMKMGMALGCVILVLMMIRPGVEDQGRLYVLKATGDVSINKVSFFQKQELLYDTKNEKNIDVGSGECVIQLDKDKLLMLSPGSKVRIKTGKKIRLHLTQGLIIAKVVKNRGNKGLNIITEQAEFDVTGTVFYIKAEKGEVECGVQTGEVRTTIKDREYHITSREKLQIREHCVKEFTGIKAEEMGVFDKLKDHQIYGVHGPGTGFMLSRGGLCSPEKDNGNLIF
ncbi:MAG: FecR domain-containing protein [bacterium]|nr:FecR domain-containing protein [bacterium]